MPTLLQDPERGLDGQQLMQSALHWSRLTLSRQAICLWCTMQPDGCLTVGCNFSNALQGWQVC